MTPWEATLANLDAHDLRGEAAMRYEYAAFNVHWNTWAMKRDLVAPLASVFDDISEALGQFARHAESRPDTFTQETPHQEGA